MSIVAYNFGAVQFWINLSFDVLHDCIQLQSQHKSVEQVQSSTAYSAMMDQVVENNVSFQCRNHEQIRYRIVLVWNIKEVIVLVQSETLTNFIILVLSIYKTDLPHIFPSALWDAPTTPNYQPSIIIILFISTNTSVPTTSNISASKQQHPCSSKRKTLTAPSSDQFYPCGVSAITFQCVVLAV